MDPDVGGEDRDGHVEEGKNQLRMACQLEKDLPHPPPQVKILSTRARLADDYYC